MTKDQDPGLVLTYTGDLPQQRKIVLQTGMPSTAPVDALHAQLDKMRVAFDRQFAFGELEHHKLQLEQEEKIAHDHAKRLSVVEENVARDWQANGHRGDAKLSSAKQKDKEQAYAAIEESKSRIQRVRRLMAECEAKIADDNKYPPQQRRAEG